MPRVRDNLIGCSRIEVHCVQMFEMEIKCFFSFSFFDFTIGTYFSLDGLLGITLVAVF